MRHRVLVPIAVLLFVAGSLLTRLAWEEGPEHALVLASGGKPMAVIGYFSICASGLIVMYMWAKPKKKRL